ncbi:MAG: hypothetical protein WCB63_06150 [Polyangiales bacterium]
MTEQRRNSFINFRGLEDSETESDLVAWEDVCGNPSWQGRWVAIDGCAYNDAGKATAGFVVDYDDNLAELCVRLSAERRKSCSVVFCSASAESAA